ncbi:unnamed protein product [Cyprideis torosa]|uniref:Uncharacterized protein n=1 Tax=Cyprideis torosa TaxID=163714 RepID=A0A7R8WU71_9CRUS|nr:unnamed protein product [Cyprideis torosa]CAG0905388.1 unnamed protein product [Cyprideis torosa]
MDFNKAQIYCETMNGKLAEFQTVEKWFTFKDYVISKLQPAGYDYAWIGGEQRGKSMQWQWISNERPVQVYDWFHTQPNDPAPNSGLAIVIHEKGQWGDSPKTESDAIQSTHEFYAYPPLCETCRIEIQA